METDSAWFIRTSDGQIYGPVVEPTLLAWAREGRVEPTSEISPDRERWIPVSCKRELEMDWIVEQGADGCFGPFHRDVIRTLIEDGQIQPTDRIYKRMPFGAPNELAAAQAEVEKAQKEVESAQKEVASLKDEVKGHLESIRVKDESIKVKDEAIKERDESIRVKDEALKEKDEALRAAEERVRKAEERAQEAERRNVKPTKGGLFFGRSLKDLAMMEEAARRELAAARQFGRRPPMSGGDVIDVGSR